jgi:predicted  nucleic acid-binding Zn-ribbon protein
VHPDVIALLAVQAEDDVVDDLVARLEAIAPRLAALDTARAATVTTIANLRSQIDADDRKRTELLGRLGEHKERQERNVAQLNVVKRMREATAAASQVEMGRKLMLELENAIRELTTRLGDARKSLEQREAELIQLDEDQATARTAIGAEQEELQAALVGARAARDARAEHVGAPLRAKYERIRARRRSTSLFALESGACGSCDTSIPVQRRNAMTSSGAIEVCEACGVLIYARE